MQAAADTLAASSLMADSVAARDSLAAAQATSDSAGAAIDSTGIVALGESVGEAGDLIAQGRLGEAAGTFGGAVLDFTIAHVVPALVVAVVFYVVYRVLNKVLSNALIRSHRVSAGVRQLAIKALRLVLLSFAALTVLGQLGINVTALIAGLGIAGIAFGFAARDTLENLIAGITILVDGPFRVGDNIRIQDTFGTVEEITLRSTRLRTLDNQIAIIPNAKMITEKIINHTMLDTLRVRIPFGIAYKESPDEARRVVIEAIQPDDRLDPSYPPKVVVTELSDSAVSMELRLYLKETAMESPVRADYRELVFTTLKSAGIEIPFPHLQLFIDEAKAFEGSQLLGGDGA